MTRAAGRACLALLAIGACGAPETPGGARPASAPASSSAAARAEASKVQASPFRPESLFLAGFALERAPELHGAELGLRGRRLGSGELGELDARQLVLRRAEGSVVVRFGADYPTATEAVRETDRQCSFVIDCEQPAVVALHDAIAAEHPQPTAEELAGAVERHITKKSYGRAFDVASVVARRREGDCTEHAVLLAALFRSFGVPARVITGIALIEIGGEPAAFGHAWTEYHDGTAWRLADSTGLGRRTRAPRYLPVQRLRSEGPDFLRQWLTGFHLSYVEAVLVPPDH